jgi:type I restriction-modification system DNA methylase subunit
MLSEVIDHIRNRTYMGGVERDQLRVKATGEVFTPTPLVQEMLEQIPIGQFTDPTKTFLDPSCGDGQFLSEVLIRKMEYGSTFEQALSTIYGVDLMQDNVDLCRERLLCGRTDLAHIVERNIVCHDALTYDYSFNGTDLNQNDLTLQNLFEFV